MTGALQASSGGKSRRTNSAIFHSLLWATITVYALSRVLQVYPGPVPMIGIVGLHVFPPLVFALAHGAVLYNSRVVVVFVAICLVVGNLIENLGVSTGFPFGRYYFTDVMGPKVLNVNIMLGAAYVGMGYLSWIVAATILRRVAAPVAERGIFALPLLAAAVMTSWDLAMDPIWSTVKHAWIWVNGGPYFGVPLSNFPGWYLTVYLIFQLFALYLRRLAGRPRPFSVNLLRLAIVFYAISAGGNLLLFLPSAEPTLIADPSGTQWRLSAITSASAFVTVFTMGTFAIIAWIRLNKDGSNFQTRAAGSA